MPDTETQTFKRGDIIRVKAEYARPSDVGRTWKVTKVNPVNLLAEMTDGSGRTLRINPMYAEIAPDGEGTKAAEPTLTPYEPPLAQGTVVTAANLRIRGMGKVDPADPWVVINVSNAGKYSLARLGGVGGSRYIAGVHRNALTVVDPARITIADA